MMPSWQLLTRSFPRVGCVSNRWDPCDLRADPSGSIRTPRGDIVDVHAGTTESGAATMASTDEGWLVGGDLMDLGGDAPACPAAVDARTPPLVASPLNDITKMANLKPVRTAVPPGSALHRTLSIESKSAGSSPHDGPFPFAPSPVATKAATVKTKFTPTATKMAAGPNAAAATPIFKSQPRLNLCSSSCSTIQIRTRSTPLTRWSQRLRYAAKRSGSRTVRPGRSRYGTTTQSGGAGDGVDATASGKVWRLSRDAGCWRGESPASRGWSLGTATCRATSADTHRSARNERETCWRMARAGESV